MFIFLYPENTFFSPAENVAAAGVGWFVPAVCDPPPPHDVRQLPDDGSPAQHHSTADRGHLPCEYTEVTTWQNNDDNVIVQPNGWAPIIQLMIVVTYHVSIPR